MEVAGLQDEPRMWGGLEIRKEGEGEEYLTEVVYLEVRV